MIHLSDDQITRLLSDELGSAQKRRTKRHLDACWQCRARYEEFERAALAVVTYRKALLREDKRNTDAQRSEFIDRARTILRAQEARSRWAFHLPTFSLFAKPSMDSTFGVGVALACASLFAFYLWFQHRAPDITSNALLVRAEVWDGAGRHDASSVIRQKVEISTSKKKVVRSIYRDMSGRRRPVQTKLSTEEAELRQQLAFAGVSWDAPLSATTYQDWHDRQRERRDEITRSGKHLICLTTFVPTGVVAKQSLTVRDTDFHPIARSVLFRDGEPVQIAELNYDEISLKSVGAGVFQPDLSRIPGGPVPTDAPRLPVQLPKPVTESDLDEAKLGALLVLNMLRGDTGEQLEVARADGSIEVKGIVDTEKRKNELQAQLRMVPHVISSISSIEELSRKSTSPQLMSEVTASAVTHPSPLQNYLEQQGRNTASISALSGKLLSTAVTVNLESRQLADLVDQYAGAMGKDRLSEIGRATLMELIFSHRNRMIAALEEENGVLAQANGTAVPDESGITVDGDPDSLRRSAELNLRLCKELTFGSDRQARPADGILADLNHTVNQLHSSALGVQVESESAILSTRRK